MNQKLSSKKVIEQLGSAQKYVFQKAKASFEKHAKNCKNHYVGPEGEEKCTHPQGDTVCSIEKCPKLGGGRNE